ncbi:MAG: CHAP domain-containing protein [Bacillota bacterium]
MLPVSQLHSSTEPQHLKIARTFVGVKEKTNHNDGPEVKMFLASVGLPEGYSWCAAFVSYCLSEAHVRFPSIRSAMAKAFETKQSIPIKDVVTGKVKIPSGSIIVFGRGNSIYGHTGFIVYWSKDRGRTIEGNTSSGVRGSQSDGDGVYVRDRFYEPSNYFRARSFLEVKY